MRGGGRWPGGTVPLVASEDTNQSIIIVCTEATIIDV